MTFILGWTTAKDAVLATDTRVTNTSNAEFWDNPAGKLEQLTDGWGAGSGLRDWTRLAFDLIRNIPASDTFAISAALSSLHASDAVRALWDGMSFDVLKSLRQNNDLIKAEEAHARASVQLVAGTLGQIIT